MREKILKMLRNADGYVSGQKLCETLGVSRTAVWKAIGQLREEGYAIEAVTNRGYRLQDPQEMDILNQEELEEAETKLDVEGLIRKAVDGIERVVMEP